MVDPLLAGATHDRSTWPAWLGTVGGFIDGAAGTEGAVAVSMTDAGPVPASLVAETRTETGTPCASVATSAVKLPVTTIEFIKVPAPRSHSTRYDSTESPPSCAGAVHPAVTPPSARGTTDNVGGADGWETTAVFSVSGVPG